MRKTWVLGRATVISRFYDKAQGCEGTGESGPRRVSWLRMLVLAHVDMGGLSSSGGVDSRSYPSAVRAAWARRYDGAMVENKAVENPGSTFTQVLDAAARLPGVRIERAAYLRSSLKRYCSDDQIAQAIDESPAAAGVPPNVVTEVANTSIRFDTSKVTGISTLAGVPGGFAMIGTVPADLVQYFGHVLRVAQKLAYIYSWPDLFTNDGEDLDEATEGMLTLLVGVMFSVQLAQAGVSKASTMVAAQVMKKLPQQALTQGTIYPIVKSVDLRLGADITKHVFAGGVAKLIPLVGAVLSGGLTLATFLPMSKPLQKHLASLELTKPGNRADDSDEIIDVEVIDAGAGETLPTANKWLLPILSESSRDRSPDAT
jgi:hypothetical protein